MDGVGFSLDAVARGLLSEQSESGFLADPNIEQVIGVTGSAQTTKKRLVDGQIETLTAFDVQGSNGGVFTIFEDGSFLFDSTDAFDDLTGSDTRTTELEVTISGAGGLRTETLAVVVSENSFAPRFDDGFTDDDFSNLAPMEVDGQFEQIGGVDVIEELFARADSLTQLDLDAFLDMTIVDIDSSFSFEFDPINGVAASVTDNSENPDALLDGVADLVAPVIELVEDGANAILTAPVSPIAIGPTFAVDFGFMANLGWDIDLPSLGKTSLIQPVTLDLFVPDGPVGEYDAFNVVSGNYVSQSPTTTVQTVGLGDIAIDAGFQITEATVSNVGFEVATRDFLNFDFEGLAGASLTLNNDFDLTEYINQLASGITGVEDQATSVSLSFSNLLAGIVAMEVDLGQMITDLKDAIRGGDLSDIQSAFTDLFNTVVDALQLASGDDLPRYDLFGVEVTSVELAALIDRAAFNDFDVFKDGDGFFEFEGDQDPILISEGQVTTAAEQTGVTSTIAGLAQIFGEDGFQPFEGLAIHANLPFGNIEQVEGFGLDAEGNPITESQSGPSTVQIEQVTRLAGLSLDFDLLAPELTRFAIDQITTVALEAAKSQPYLIPIVAAASIAAKTALTLGLEAERTFEEGFSIEAQVQPTAIVAAALNPIIDILNSVSSVIEAITGVDTPKIDALTPEGVQGAIDAVIDAVVDQIVEVLDFIANAASEVLELIAESPPAEAVQAAINAFADTASAVTGGLDDLFGGVWNTIFGAFDMGPITDVVDALRSIPDLVDEVGDQLDSVIGDILAGAVAFQADVLSDLGDVATELGGFLKDLAAGATLVLDTDFNLFDFILDAGIDLVQTAVFDPDEVQVSYTIDGQTLDASFDQATEFFAKGKIGDVLDGHAAYSFSGDVDYDYRVQLNIDPELTLWGTELNGAMTLGSGNAYEIDFDYAALKLTDDVTLETLDDILDGDLGELRQLFDDALVEIPVGLFEEVAEVAVDGIRNSLGGFAGQTDDLAWNEIRLFTLDDVEIGADEFVALETEFQIEIGEPDAEPSAIFDTSESDSGLTLADGSLFARAQGTLAKLDGDIANVDTIRSVEGGGLFALGRDGALAFDAGGSYEHVGEGDVAAERFSFTLMGDDGLERGYVAEIRVAGENDLPDGVADSVTLAEDGVLSFDPAANDTDIDEGDVLRVIAVGDPDNGTATVDAAGVVTFTPDPDFFGTTTLSYTVSDEHGGTDTSSVEITVVPVGDIVRPGDDALQVSESASGQINVLANDIEVDGDGPLRVEGVSAPASGALADVAANSTLNYDPNGAFDHLAAGETARETLNVTVTDDVDGSATSTVEITIEGENDAPVAEDDVAATDEDTPILLSVLDNDTDVDASDVLGFDPDAAPTAEHGTVTIEGQQLRYTPDVDFYGTDIITYQITDGNGGTSQAKAEVAVRSIADNTLTADASDEIAISGTSSTDTRFVGSDGVQTIRNTTEGQDFDLTAAEFESVEALDGAGGTLRIAADGILDLSPLTSIQNLSGIRAAGGAETIIGSIFADQVDGGAGIDTYRVAGSFFDFDVEVSGPGAATITRDGVTDTLAGMERIVFDDVTLATDGNSSPFTRDDTITLVQTGRLTVTSAALVANDIDIDGDTITVTDLTGTDEITVAASANGFVLQATSALAHMVEEDQLYVDLTYTARDGQGGESTGTVTVKIEGANDTPTVPTSALRLGENEGANGNLLEYAVDPDTGSVMTVTAVAGAELRDGVFALTLPTGVIATIHPDGTYELAASDANDGLARGQTAFDGVRFTVTDDAGAETAGLLQLTIMGENDQVNDPVTRVETDALTEIDVAADVGALSDASDPDAGSGFAMTSPVSGAVIDGDAGGTFTLQSDGSFSFDPGHDFFDLGIDDVRTTTATYTVLDNEGAATEGTISVDVKGADIAPFLSDDARYDALSSFVFGELDATTVVGSFYQIGGVDVTEALFAELDEATGFDINDWLDFTLIDLNKRLHLSSTFEDGLTFVLEDVEEAEGALAALNDDFNEIVGDALSAVEAVADTVLPLDLGPIEQTLLFDATVGLDLELGWDIDIPTLGKTAVFQPFELTLNTPDRAVADDFLVLNSAEFVAHSPTSVTETVGVGSFQVIAGLEMPDTQVDGLGVGIRTSDFLGFELDGLASASVTLDRVFTLDEAIETTKTLVLDAVGTIVQAIPADIPFDIEKVLSTILSLDLGNLVEGLFSSELDIEPLLDALQAEGFEAKLDGILDFIATLSESGSNVNATIAVGGAIATETEIFTLTNRAMFNEFDGFDDDGVGYFDMDDGAGGTVEVQAQPLQDIRDFLGIDENVNAFARALNEIGLSPVEGAVVQVAAPIGNVEQIEGFETLEDGSRDTASRDGEQVIEIVQETRLIDVDVDLDSLGQALIDKALELATGDGASPASTIVGIAQALGVEQQEILEEGIRLDIELRPAQLVVATANGIIDNFNLVAEALGGLVGVDAPTIDRIAESDVLDDVDAAIDSSISVLTDGFDLLGDLMAGPAEVLQDLLDAGGLTSIDDVLGAFSTTSAIDTALDLLDDIDNFSILGFDVIPSSAVDPIRAIMQVARDVAQGVDSAADAVADVISAIEGAVIDLLNFDPTEGFSAILEEVASVLKDAARGGDISVTTAFDVLTAQLDAGLDLIQVATFNPDHVTVNYEIGEFNLDAGLGEDAGFFVAGEAGDEITGTATYGYSGAVDYEYYLRLDVNPTFEFFGVDISGEFAIGENIEFSFDEEYALAAIGETSPLNGDGFASQFDEALFELNFDFLTEIGQMVQGQLAAAVDLPLGDVVDLEAGEILLFALDDVELEVDRFTSVEEEFTVSLIDNFVPVIDHASFTVAEDATLTGVFAARDENDLLSELTFSVADGQGPAHGTLTFGDEGAFTYQPDADFNGVETFAITVADGADRAETPATITVDVQSVEDAPRAPDQAIRVPAEGTLGPVTGTLQATDADDQTLSFTLVTAPDNGTFALAGDGSYTFTPDAGFSAASSFQVQVSDGVSGPVNFIVTIGPNTAPVIGDATLVVSENTPLEFTPTATDAEGDEVTFREAASLRSRNGTLTQLESGAFSYVPMAGFWGVDSFALAATDGQLSDEAVFTVNVARDAADDDDVEGSSAAEDINGSQGADVIAPGLGADRVTTSGGADKVIGDLEELDGDTLLDLTSEDRIVVQNAGFEPQDVTFDRVAGRLSFDSDGDGVADATLHVEDVKPDERFLVFETEEGTQAVLAQELPYLAEDRAVSNSNINGIVVQEFLNGGDGVSFNVTISSASGAAFLNSVGYYEVAENGDISNVRLLTSNAQGGGDFVIGSLAEGQTLGFFLAQNAHSATSGAILFDILDASGGTANVFADDSFVFRIDGEDHVGAVFHSFDADMNTNNIQHVLSGVSQDGISMFVGFEDQLNGGDRDYQDVLFDIDRIVDIA